MNNLFWYAITHMELIIRTVQIAAAAIAGTAFSMYFFLPWPEVKK